MNSLRTVAPAGCRLEKPAGSPLPPSLIALRRACEARRRVPKGMVSMLVALWSPKGGSGTSVLAAALALSAAARGETRLADLGGDQPAILGLPPLASFVTLADWLAGGASAPTDWLDDMAVPVAPGLLLLPGGPPAAAASPEAGAALAVALRDDRVAVVDAGSGPDPYDGAGRALVDVADAAVAVIRPCYLALRAAVDDPRLGSSVGVIVVEESGRALDGDDVESVLGLPIVARVPRRAEIARAVDSGVLRDRVPAPLAACAGTVLDRLSGLANGRWAA